jgi:hypothetical protein
MTLAGSTVPEMYRALMGKVYGVNITAPRQEPQVLGGSRGGAMDSEDSEESEASDIDGSTNGGAILGGRRRAKGRAMPGANNKGRPPVDADAGKVRKSIGELKSAEKSEAASVAKDAVKALKGRKAKLDAIAVGAEGEQAHPSLESRPSAPAPLATAVALSDKASSGKGLVGGKRCASSWQLHIKKVASENKGTPFKDIVKMASASYKKGSAIVQGGAKRKGNAILGGDMSPVEVISEMGKKMLGKSDKPKKGGAPLGGASLGGKAKRAPSAWQKLVSDTAKGMKGAKFAEIIAEAKKQYRS